MSYKIAVISQTGDCGKSAISLTLALEALKSKREVKIIDLDKEHQSCIHWKNDRELFEVKPALDVTLADNGAEAIEADEGAFATIFDCPSRATELTPKIAAHVDLVVIPTPPNQKSIREHLKLVAMLLKKKIPAHKISIMLTRVKTESEEDNARHILNNSDIAGQTLEELGVKIYDASIFDKAGYSAALDRSEGLTDTYYKSLNSEAKIAINEIMFQALENYNK